MGIRTSIHIRISIGVILSISLVFLVVIPIVMLRGMVRQTAHQAVESEVVRLNVGILDTARQNLGMQLEGLRMSFDGAKNLPDGRDIRIFLHQQQLGDAYLLPIDRPGDNLIYRLEAVPRTDPVGDMMEFRLVSQVIRVDYRSQTLAVLEENPERLLCLGRLSFLPQLGEKIWLVGQIRWGERPAVLMLSVNLAYLTGFLNRLSEAVASRVYLVTADNMVMPHGESGLFDQPFAARALSRTREGVFFSFADHVVESGTLMPVLVHVYADPLFLYNLVAVTPQANLTGAVDGAINQTTVLTGVVAALFGFLTLGLVGLLSRQLRHLTIQLARIANGEHIRPRTGGLVCLSETDRIAVGIGALSERLEENQRLIDESRLGLEQRVSERTATLTATLHELQNAQEMLVQTEKMAALGRTVASFTHEINNPLGASVTALSKLQETVAEIQAAHVAKTLTGSAFSQGMATIAAAAEMVAHNLGRATSITGSLKHVAADQSHADIREFVLGDYLQEIITSLQPMFKRGVHTVRLKSAPDIRMTGNPAVFYQIISNLVINSLKHGFEGRQSGLISLSADLDGDQVVISYSDDGIGMTGEQLSRMYEPFFTTKRGSGGTGIGMSVVYSLIHDELAGTIHCESEPGDGVRFTIRFPRARLSKEAP